MTEGSTAEHVLGLVAADPRRARAEAELLVRRARRDGPVADVVVLERALGLAARELHDNATAARHLRRSVRLAERHALRELTAESRMSLALVVEEAGRPLIALREIDRAVDELTGLPAARARMQRAIILRRLGREREALNVYGAELDRFRRGGDRLWQARVLTNRGVLHALRGGLRIAERDLRAAEQLYVELGLPAMVAQVRHNLGFVAAQGGSVPTAITWYDLADRYFRQHGRPAVALVDRAELLLAARLYPEAREVAGAAVDSCIAAGLRSLLPQARLLFASASLGMGELVAARESARAAGRSFQRQQRPAFAALARFTAWSATPAEPSRARLTELNAIAGALDGTGSTEAALEARLRAVEVAAALPGSAVVEAITSLTVAVGSASGGTARLRIRHWYARAVAHQHAGNRLAAKRALRSGLRLVDAYRAALGATDLRVHSSAEGADLARMGLRLALADHQPRSVLEWVERWRAAALRLPPVLPAKGSDTALATDLAKLRRVSGELSVGSAGSLDPGRRRTLLRRQRELEDAIRRRTWQTAGSGAGTGPVRVERILATLDKRALLELVELDGELTAIVAVDGRVSLRPIGSAVEVDAESAALRFALCRLAARHGTAASAGIARAAADHAAARLDELIIGPVRRLLGDRALVVVPTGTLHSLPWSALPGLRDRAISVAPSAAALVAADTGNPRGATVLVAASTPPHAGPEVVALQAEVPSAILLRGSAARVPAVLAALDGAATAHLATHGTFRSDNPMFSHLLLADGPLTVYDLLRLRRPPRLVVLSACDTGLSAVHPGDELMGLASALLGMGTRSLVASVGPVDDSATRDLMLRLHRELRAGLSPAGALAAAQMDTPDAEWATARSFLCFGS